MTLFYPAHLFLLYQLQQKYALYKVIPMEQNVIYLFYTATKILNKVVYLMSTHICHIL
jgi:hypothetical protein